MLMGSLAASIRRCSTFQKTGRKIGTTGTLSPPEPTPTFANVEQDDVYAPLAAEVASELMKRKCWNRSTPSRQHVQAQKPGRPAEVFDSRLAMLSSISTRKRDTSARAMFGVHM